MGGDKFSAVGLNPVPQFLELALRSKFRRNKFALVRAASGSVEDCNADELRLTGRVAHRKEVRQNGHV